MILGIYAAGFDGRDYEGEFVRRGVETIAGLVGQVVPITVYWTDAGEDPVDARGEVKELTERLRTKGYLKVNEKKCKRLPECCVRRERKEVT